MCSKTLNCKSCLPRTNTIIPKSARESKSVCVKVLKTQPVCVRDYECVQKCKSVKVCKVAHKTECARSMPVTECAQKCAKQCTRDEVRGKCAQDCASECTEVCVTSSRVCVLECERVQEPVRVCACDTCECARKCAIECIKVWEDVEKTVTQHQVCE